MKERDAGNYHNVRCSRNNPQHVYVHKILCDLNLDIFKSRNQFIIDAVEYYSKSLNQEDLSRTAAMEYIHNSEKKEDLDIEELKKEIISEVTLAVQTNVIAALMNEFVKVSAQRGRIVKTEEHDEYEDEEQAINPVVKDMATLWGEMEE